MSFGPALDRRALLRGSLLLGATGLLTACSTAVNEAGPVTGATRTPNPTGSTATLPGAAASRPGSRPRTLLAYFSRPGENYYYGGRRDLQVGNTQVIADMIAELADVDIYRLEAADPYPQDYEQTVERNTREQRDDARPALAQPPPDVEQYDVVLLGSPVWSSRAPTIMLTFLDAVDLSGKTVHPFVTHAVSGMNGIAGEYAQAAPGATVTAGLAVQGEEAADARPQVAQWLRDQQR